MDLLSWIPPSTDRHGSTYAAEFDFHRLNAQAKRVYNCLASGCWMTLREIAAVTGDPEASCSARFRDLKNMHGLKTEKRRRGEPRNGIWEYRLAV